MLKLLDKKELRNFSIFIVWLINISGFFGILSDQKDFFLSSSPYVLTLTLFLLVINNSIEKRFLISLFLIFLFPKSIIPKVLIGSAMMILLDLLIEISAPKLDYWEFAIHPVPFSNYLWWFIFSVLFHLIYQSNTNKEFIVSTNILVVHFLFFGMLAVFL